MEVVPTTGGPHPFGVMAQRLRAGKLVCIVADRDLSDTGVEVDFFGEKALFPAGPAALAVQTGAALMPVACWFVGETEWGAHIHDEIPVPAEGDRKQKVAAMTQALARVFEQAISEHPEDWHMLQKVFVSDLDPERLARSRARAVGGNGTTGQRDRRGQRLGHGAARAEPRSQRMRPGRARADRHRVPVLLGRARRSAAAHQGPGRGADRARPRGLGDRARRRGPPAAALRGPGRARRCRCRTTGRWPGWRSARCRRTGSAAGCATATSTCCTCTSPRCPRCRCSPAGWRPARSWRPCTPRCASPGCCSPPSRCSAPRLRRSTAGSRSPRRPGRRSSSTWAATPC